MKQVELYATLNDYLDSIRNKDHAVPNVAQIGEIGEEYYRYDRIVLTYESNPVLFNIATGAGWNFTFDSAVTNNELGLVNWIELTKAIRGNTAITNFDEFKYFDGVTYIPHGMFDGCTSITSITVPQSVTEMEAGAFDSFPNNVTIIYEGNVPSIVEAPGNAITVKYTGVTSLTNIFSESSNNEIKNYLIAGYVSGGSNDMYLLPDDMVYTATGTGIDTTGTNELFITYFFEADSNLGYIIPYYSFYSCEGISEIKLGNYFSYISNNAFRGCGGLTTVDLTEANNLKVFGENCFCNCKGISDINLPDGVLEIKLSAFSNCVSIESIDIPDSVIEIGNACFNGCTGLKNVNIGNNVTKLGGFVFNRCSSLEVVTIGSGLTSLGYSDVFMDCTSLFVIKTNSLNAPSNTNYLTFRDIRPNGTLLYPNGGDYSLWLSASSSYLGYYGWRGAHIGTIALDKYSVEFCEGVSSITISVYSDNNWTASTNDSWIILPQNATGGSGVTKITFSIQISNTERSGSVMFSDGTNSTTLSVDEIVLKNTYLTFNIISPGTIYWKMSSRNATYTKTISYSKDNGNTWVSATSCSAVSISALGGDKILFKGFNNSYAPATSTASYASSFSSSTGTKFSIEGNIMSLINATGFSEMTALTSNYTFYRLFYKCEGEIDASKLLLPATTLASSCYTYMFAGCTGLTAAPKLPATSLTENCYGHMFDGCGRLTTAPALPATTLAKSCYVAMFSGCTAITAAPALPATTMKDYCYYRMFAGCTSLTTVPTLPATSMKYCSYSEMFSGCISLTTAPALPATSLSGYCYQYMFAGCTSLTTAPALTATSLAGNCYYHMFDGCTSLTTAPALPATGLARNCYSYMFAGCTSLTTAPELPATSMSQLTSDGCYSYMFAGCTSLATAPTLPATSLRYAESAYTAMFSGCTALTTAPALPATVLASSCYTYMFAGCTSLTTAPALPATEMKSHCYAYMFYDCTGLTVAPSLPATTLVEGCYLGMFTGCIGIVAAPELPALTVGDYSYKEMFNGCTNLSSITCLANNFSLISCTDSWVKGVASNGTFVAKAQAFWVSGVDGIPAGWNIVYEGTFGLQTEEFDCYKSGRTKTIGLRIAPGVTWSATTNDSWITLSRTAGTDSNSSITITVASSSTEREGHVLFTTQYTSDTLTIIQDDKYFTPLTFNIMSSGTIYWTMYMGMGSDRENKKSIQYRKNNGTWTNITSYPSASISVTAGDKVAFRGNNKTYTLPSSPSTNYSSFSSSTSTKFSIEGNIMSLVNNTDYDSETRYTNSYVFGHLFTNCVGLTSAENLLLPRKTSPSCYASMFYDCKNLVTAPELPATTLAPNCYASMFGACINLTTAPALPATTLDNGCYNSMFFSCTTITTAPALPATTLVMNCYRGMFSRCANLTAPPELTATTLAPYCYENMFDYCTSLTTAPALPATTLADSCYNNMFDGCTSLTTAPALPATELFASCYYGMFNGCTSLTTAPELPATTLANYCYYQMFNGCTNLNYIKCLATYVAGTNHTRNWVSGVQTTSGTFVKHPDMTSWPSGPSGIPNNWTVQDAVL